MHLGIELAAAGRDASTATAYGVQSEHLRSVHGLLVGLISQREIRVSPVLVKIYSRFCDLPIARATKRTFEHIGKPYALLAERPAAHWCKRTERPVPRLESVEGPSRYQPTRSDPNWPQLRALTRRNAGEEYVS
jgi:hypothetical protein